MLAGSCALRQHVRARPARERLHWHKPLPPVLLRRSLGSGTQRQRCQVIVAATDPYVLLGVSRNSSVDDIKKAFRKRALKLHPDVNKAPDAKERFMEAKQAYQRLLDEREGRGSASSASSAGYSSKRGSTARGGTSAWGSGGTYGSSKGYGYSQSYQQPRVPPEESYGFGDLLRDLDKELSNYARRRQQGLGSSASVSSSAPKSLWEELYDIGEEFVEFLEQGLGVSDDEATAYGAFKKEYGDLSGHASSSSTSQSRSSGSAGASRSSASPRAEPPGSGTNSSSSGAGAAGVGSQGHKPTTAEYVEEELAALKRKLGKQ